MFYQYMLVKKGISKQMFLKAGYSSFHTILLKFLFSYLGTLLPFNQSFFIHNYIHMYTNMCTYTHTYIYLCLVMFYFSSEFIPFISSFSSESEIWFCTVSILLLKVSNFFMIYEINIFGHWTCFLKSVIYHLYHSMYCFLSFIVSFITFSN